MDHLHLSEIGDAAERDQPAVSDAMAKATVIATLMLALAAIITNFQTCYAFKDSREAFQTSQRPYVSLGRKDGTVAEFAFDNAHPDNPVGLKVYLQNGGQSAALSLRISISVPIIVNAGKAHYETGPSRKKFEAFEPIYRYKFKGGGEGSVNSNSIPPQSEFVHFDPNLFSSEVVKAFREGQQTALLPGVLEYCDIFGNYTCTSFTLTWFGPPISAFGGVLQGDCGPGYTYPEHPPPFGGIYIQPCEQPDERQEREKAEHAEMLKRTAIANPSAKASSPATPK